MTHAHRPGGRSGGRRTPDPLSAEPTPPIGMPHARPDQDSTEPPGANGTGETTQDTATRTGRSRLGGLWVGLIVAAVVLVLLLIFILQNAQTVRVDYFGLSGQLPLAVAILLGVAAGALLVALPGSVRILQLRRSAHRR